MMGKSGSSVHVDSGCMKTCVEDVFTDAPGQERFCLSCTAIVS